MSISTMTELNEEDIAIDEARTFVGPNASFYDESWRVMMWRGKRTSWNAHAALLGPVWFAYRRMFVSALTWIGWLQFVWIAHARGWPHWLLLTLVAAAMLTSGLLANGAYLQHFQRCASRARKASDSVLEQEKCLRTEGGTSPMAAYACVALVVVQSVLNLAGSLATG
ncbi:MAG: DUF2628 domain-containing protein [Geminicoccaceae bacterium]